MVRDQRIEATNIDESHLVQKLACVCHIKHHLANANVFKISNSHQNVWEICAYLPSAKYEPAIQQVTIASIIIKKRNKKEEMGLVTRTPALEGLVSFMLDYSIDSLSPI